MCPFVPRVPESIKDILLANHLLSTYLLAITLSSALRIQFYSEKNLS